MTLKCRNQVFVQVGFYVNNTYEDQELQEYPPEKPDFEKLTREILISQPRITHYKINWSKLDSEIAVVEETVDTEEKAGIDSSL